MDMNMDKGRCMDTLLNMDMDIEHGHRHGWTMDTDMELDTVMISDIRLLHYRDIPILE